MIEAWHFTTDKLRDGSPIPPVGESLVWDGCLVMCSSGLHASRRILDAVRYAPGTMCHRVHCEGEILEDNHKLVCTKRTIAWSVDAADVLREFARWCALSVAEYWDAPPVVMEYLQTGRDELREQARAAAQAAQVAQAAAQVAQAAAQAAQAATWDAHVARAAARAAAQAAQAAAQADTWDARAATWDAHVAAWDAAWDAQNEQLERMTRAAYEKTDLTPPG